ncbi:MAG TPA: carboxypeptidase-like regulatory domain-containing protein [Chloroflexota bacterium]|nr:carboxypeptidase-like regulatory domain-containing protein [Chloroflexota bacterium]
MHGQHSARHLDDPIRPFAGLTVGQLLSLLLGAGAGFATYRLSVRFPNPNGVVTELYIFLVIAVAAGFACVGMLLAGGNGEPFGAQIVGYLRRRHRYALPAPRRTRRQRRWLWSRVAADSIALLPRSRSAPLHGLGGIHFEPDGLVTLPDGDPRLYLAVDAVNFDCCAPEERDLFADCWSRVVGLLPPGQHLQVLIENRPLQPATILEKIQRDLRPDSPALKEFVSVSSAWWEQQLVRAHVPDHRFTIVLAPGPNRLKQLGRAPRSPELQLVAARRNLDDLARTIEQTFRRRRMGCRRMPGEEVLHLLWDGLHPGGSPCPPLTALQQPEAPVAADQSLRATGARQRRRQLILVVPFVVGLVVLSVGLVLSRPWAHPQHTLPRSVAGNPDVLTLTTSTLGKTTALVVTLTDPSGAPISDATIVLTVGGHALQTVRTGTTGLATFHYRGGPGPATVYLTAMLGGRQVAVNTFKIGETAPISTSPVTGRFYPSDNVCSFNTLPASLTAFSLSFPTLNFGGRPFTGYPASAGGRSVSAVKHGQVAGMGPLDHFDAVFTGTFYVSHPGTVPFTILIDDAFDLGIGGGARRVGGTMSNPPDSGRTALLRLPVVGAFNQGHLQATTGVTVSFPHAGAYVYEVDYAECDGGGESLRISSDGRFLPETANGAHHATP